jgi:Outer membrane efflux protein
MIGGSFLRQEVHTLEMNANKVIAAIISNFTDQHSPVTTPTFDVLDRFGKPGEIVVERANERTLKLATEQFQRGAGDFLNVVDAQTALISSQSATLDAKLGTEVALVSLYRSLGGGRQLLSSPVNDKQ